MVKQDIILFEDPFDSPLASPTPLMGGALQATSVLAEHIFNDPEAWEVPEDASSHRPDDDLPIHQKEMEEEMAWLESEIGFDIPFTPSMLDVVGSPLPDEDDGILPNFDSPYSINVTSRFQDIANHKRTVHPKSGPTATLPPYVHSPPSGFNDPRQEPMKGLTEHRDDDTLHFFNPDVGSQDRFGASLHAFLLRVLRDKKTTQPIMGRVSESSSVNSSPLSSEFSSRSNSTSPCSSRSSPTLDLQVSPSHRLPEESAFAARNTSPIKSCSASSTVSPVVRHDSSADPSTGIADARELLLDVPALSSTKHRIQHPSRDQLLPRPAIINTSVSDDVSEHIGTLPDVLQPVHEEKGLGRVGNRRTCETIKTGANDLSSTRDQHAEFKFPENSRRRGIFCESPSRRKLKSPQFVSRDSPIPPPIIPLPNLPDDNPPPVPPKDNIPSAPKTDVNVNKTNNIRRLPTVPTVPTQHTTPGCELNVNANTRPPPPLPHMRTHSIPSTTHFSSTTVMTPPRRQDSLPATFSTNTRSLPCPAGPRQRSCMNNNYAPIRPAWYAKTQVISNTSVSGKETMAKHPVATFMRRSFSEPRGHMYSKSG